MSYVANNPLLFIDPDGKEIIVSRPPAEYVFQKGSLSVPSNIKTVHDLGVTGINNGFAGITYAKKKDGTYDVSATIISLVNPKLSSDYSYNTVIGQKDLRKEVQAHEEAHGNQLEEALKKNYTVNAGSVIDANGKKTAINFSGQIDKILGSADKKYDELKKSNPGLKLTKEEFIKGVYNNVLSQVSKSLQYDKEKDANERAAKKLGGVQNMPFTFGAKNIYLPQ